MANIQTLEELKGKRWRLRKNLQKRGYYIGSNFIVGCYLGTSGKLKYYYGNKVLEGNYVGDVASGGGTNSQPTGIWIGSLAIAKTSGTVGYLTDADGDSYGDNPRIVEFPKDCTLEVNVWMGSNPTPEGELQQFRQFWNANFEEVTMEESLKNIADSVRQIHGDTEKIPYLKISYELDKAVENIEKIPEGYLKPEGTLDIAENGKHNVTIYEEVDVNVPIPDGYIVPSGKVEIKTTEEVNVTEYAKAQIVDENLKAENIAENVEVLGITGTFKGGIDTTGTATADDLLLGKTAYVNDKKIIGTIPTYDGSNSDGSKPEIDEFLENVVTEYTNNRIVKVGSGKFAGNTLITEVHFANVEEVEDRAFNNSGKLAIADMPKLKKVGEYAFNSTLITGESPMFNSIETLGANAFWSCTKLGDVNMPNLVGRIPQNAFNNSGLTSFRADKVVCETATLSGNTAFSGCTKLEYVHFDKLQIVGTQWFNSCKALKKAEFNSVKTFRGYAFQGCSALEVIIIRTPDVVASIDSNMFHSFTFTGTVFVPDNMVDQYKISTNWSVYADRIKPLSEYVEV